jgi:AcrR family transcriptional regulator
VPRLNTDTKAEIKAVALELFAANGVDRTSLREIAERLGITKAALYYHFASKTELLTDLVRPLIDDLRAFRDAARPIAADRPREVLEGYFDLCYRHRLLFQVLLRDASIVGQVGMLGDLLHSRTELDGLMVGSDAPVDRVRAVVAFGGMQDCIALYPDATADEIRTAAVDAAYRALLPG